MSVQRVFGCDDLRGEIMSFFPKRCLHCRRRMNNLYKNCNKKFYRNDDWRRSENGRMLNYCNWCVCYVFEYY
jgi:hypothetical protein